jgi:hypothetical protein
MDDSLARLRDAREGGMHSIAAGTIDRHAIVRALAWQSSVDIDGVNKCTGPVERPTTTVSSFTPTTE